MGTACYKLIYTNNIKHCLLLTVECGLIKRKNQRKTHKKLFLISQYVSFHFIKSFCKLFALRGIQRLHSYFPFKRSARNNMIQHEQYLSKETRCFSFSYFGNQFDENKRSALHWTINQQNISWFSTNVCRCLWLFYWLVSKRRSSVRLFIQSMCTIFLMKHAIR